MKSLRFGIEIELDCSEVVNAINENDCDVYVIKSTVPVGFVDQIKEETGKRIVFSPEYYGGTQHCNNFDFNFTILGGSKITCRFLYGDEFEYLPKFKIWIATNHKPIIRGTDFGIWRRIKLIPFEVNIPKEKVDKSLKYRLRKEFPQILKWAVDGCILWQREGLEEPKCVQDAVKEYKQEMDLLAGFLEQCIEIDYENDERIMASDLFGLYSKWAKRNNEYEMTSKKFFREVSKKLPEKGRCGKGIFYSNIRLTEYAEELDGIRQYDWQRFN